MGSILGMFVASNVILSSLQSDKRDAAGNVIFSTLGASEKAAIRAHDFECHPKSIRDAGLFCHSHAGDYHYF